MHIQELRLRARDVVAQRAFYATALELPVSSDTADSITIQVGTSRLVFEAAHDQNSGTNDPRYHIAFTIPRNKLAAAKAWLAARTPLLTRDGQDEFGSTSWDAQQVYFRDPADNIMELIARQSLPNDAPGTFGPSDLLCVSEIGLPVEDVSQRAGELTLGLGINYYHEHSDTFAPLGDAHGLFIIVAIGRLWLPTDDAHAAPAPVHVVVRGPTAKTFHTPGLPYTVIMRPD